MFRLAPRGAEPDAVTDLQDAFGLEPLEYVASTVLNLMLRFYDTSLGIATRAGREAPMPSIVSSEKCA